MKLTARVPKIRGAAAASPEFWHAVAIMCTARGWDPGAIAAVMSLESAGTYAPDAGWRQWSPKRTATGLIQFIESTARRLGVARAATCDAHPELTARGEGKTWATWTLMLQSPIEQLRLVESYYLAVVGGPDSSWRPVDYYLATWGSLPGRPMTDVLAERDGAGKTLYAANVALDRDKDGKIEVSDLDAFISTQYPTEWTPVDFEAPDAEVLTPSERVAKGGFVLFSAGLLVATTAAYLWLRK